jgi:sulfur-oxidizing protein SoxX
MPSYYRIDGLDRVASAYRGKPVLSAQEVEDIVAWLATLK